MTFISEDWVNLIFDRTSLIDTGENRSEIPCLNPGVLITLLEQLMDGSPKASPDPACWTIPSDLGLHKM